MYGHNAFNHAKIDATINTGGVMKWLGCDGLKNRSPHVKTLPPHAEQSLRMLRRYLRMRSRVSARGEDTPACGAGSPHAELALRTRRTYVRMRSWPSACGNGRHAVNFTSRLSYMTALAVMKF